MAILSILIVLVAAIFKLSAIILYFKMYLSKLFYNFALNIKNLAWKI